MRKTRAVRRIYLPQRRGTVYRGPSTASELEEVPIQQKLRWKGKSKEKGKSVDGPACDKEG